jgi:hypothetical protein
MRLRVGKIIILIGLPRIRRLSFQP